MIAAATDTQLCLLEFADRRMLQTQIDRLRRLLRAAFVPGTSAVLGQTEAELSEYFDGTRREFTVPMATPGTEFQREVWTQLAAIGYGETRSYAEQAQAIDRHRVVGADGKLCGYGGQLWRKQALLDWERRNA